MNAAPFRCYQLGPNDRPTAVLGDHPHVRAAQAAAMDAVRQGVPPRVGVVFRPTDGHEQPVLHVVAVTDGALSVVRLKGWKEAWSHYQRTHWRAAA